MTTEVNTEAVVAEPDDKPATGPGWQELVAGCGPGSCAGSGLTGQGRLLQQLTKRVLEPVLGREITDHLGRDQHERAGEGGALGSAWSLVVWLSSVSALYLGRRVARPSWSGDPLRWQ